MSIYLLTMPKYDPGWRKKLTRQQKEEIAQKDKELANSFGPEWAALFVPKLESGLNNVVYKYTFEPAKPFDSLTDDFVGKYARALVYEDLVRKGHDPSEFEGKIRAHCWDNYLIYQKEVDFDPIGLDATGPDPSFKNSEGRLR